VGFRWQAAIYTDCSMMRPRIQIESEAIGSDAYQQADRIAKEIETFLEQDKENGNDD
jgi:hypothetical protein